jgi:hypothetical protein
VYAYKLKENGTTENEGWHKHPELEKQRPQVSMP